MRPRRSRDRAWHHPLERVWCTSIRSWLLLRSSQLRIRRLRVPPRRTVTSRESRCLLKIIRLPTYVPPARLMGGSGPSSAARLSRTRGCDAPPWQGRSAADPGPGRGKSGHGRTSLSLTTTLINCIFEPGCVISTPRRNVRPRAAIVPPSRADAPEAPGTAVSWSCTMREADSRGMRKLLLYALLGVLGLAIAGLLRQRQRPIPIPPPLTFLFENPLVEAFAGSELLVERLDLAPGMRVLDAGCGPGRLTIPVARAVEPTGEVVALDSQRAMLEKLEHRLEAESITNVRTLEAGLGEGRWRGKLSTGSSLPSCSARCATGRRQGASSTRHSSREGSSL